MLGRTGGTVGIRTGQEEDAPKRLTAVAAQRPMTNVSRDGDNIPLAGEEEGRL